MRKIFLFFAAMLMALTASATTWNITPTHCHEGDRADGHTLYVTLDRGALDGDTIVLADGTYQEGLTMTVNHPVVIMAAEGASPVVNMSGYIKLYKSIECKGIKFDHSAVESNGYCFYPFATDIEYLVLEDCEMTGFREGCIMSWESFHIDSLALNNCYVHDNKKSVVYIPDGKCDKLVVTNSTFSNNEGSPSYVEGGWSAGILDIRNASGTAIADQKVRVDHCTFYNNSTRNSDYADVKSYKSTDVVVSNCIFYGPSATYDGRASHLYGGTVKNSLTINYKHETAGHRTGGATFSDTLLNKDPLFVNAAEGNYTLGEGSPALTAAEDGGAIGDPRWVPAPAEPLTLYLKPGADWLSWPAKYAIYYFKDGAEDKGWSEFMTIAENETDVYTTTIPAEGYDKLIFVRFNSEATAPAWDSNKWSQTVNIDFPTGENNCFTVNYGGTGDACNGVWSKYAYELPAKFYITGNAALVGTEAAWHSDAIKVTENSYTFENLAAGNYQMKVVCGEWYGLSNLTAVADGIYPDQDGNICFTMTTPGNVTVTFIKGSEGIEEFTVAGALGRPEVKIIGLDNDWSGTTALVLVNDEDGKSASLAVELTEYWYDFKVIRAGDWLSRNGEGDTNYTIHRDWNYVDGLYRDGEGVKNIVLTPDVINKMYTFKWTYATGKLEVIFPSDDPTSLDNAEAAVKTAKVLRDGQLFIRRDGKIYTTTGVQVK